MGFAEVYDYVAGRAAWLAEGLPGEGLVKDEIRAGALAHGDVPTVGERATVADVARVLGGWELAVVVNEARIVLGVVRREVVAVDGSLPVMAVFQPAPPTVRPSIPIGELAASMDADGQERVLVTRLDGSLVGLVRRQELDAR